MYRSLLVPLDGSDLAERALPLALRLARDSGAGLQIVTVAPRLPGTLTAAAAINPAGPRSPWHDYLDQVARGLESHDGVDVSLVVLQGEPAAEIRLHAEKSKVDLIVMTTHGRGALSEFWIGSVTYQLLYDITIPVLLLRASNGTVPGDLPLRHFLAPLDGSQRAEQTLEPMLTLGQLTGAGYTLLQVTSDIPGTIDPLSRSSPALELVGQIHEAQSAAKNEAETYLAGVADRLRKRGASVQTLTTSAVDFGRAILRVADTRQYDLIALEAHGIRRSAGMALGSVSRKVIHGTPVPILVHSDGPMPESEF
ncbi:MAG TPA: universal stress protein [Planctomycetaceae bacterium]|nr:universal stress protein [Planctomycetaceae bacterium]